MGAGVPAGATEAAAAGHRPAFPGHWVRDSKLIAKTFVPPCCPCSSIVPRLDSRPIPVTRCLARPVDRARLPPDALVLITVTAYAGSDWLADYPERLVSGNALGACPLRAHVDPRLTRFSAGATAGVLAMVLLIVDVARPLGLGLLASQVAVFGFTAFVSFQWSLWAQIYARFIWPRIGAPAALEDARPARFAQLFGFVFTALALTFFVVGIDVAGYSLTALTFGLAALDASTGLCFGCRAYMLVRRGVQSS